MRLLQASAIVLLLLFAATTALAAEKTRYLDLVNRSYDSVTSLAVAAAGTDAFQQQSLGAPLRGGGGATTLEVIGEGCLYDIRLLFTNGRVLVYKEVDFCRGGKLSMRPLPPRTADVRMADHPMP